METIKKSVLQKENELDKFLNQYCNPPLFTQDGQDEIKKHLSILEMDKKRILIREGQLSNCIFYLPFDFGYIIPAGNKLSPGGQLKTGIEFRIKQTNTFFFRFNFDNRSNKYKIPACEITNVSEGKLHFNDSVRCMKA